MIEKVPNFLLEIVKEKVSKKTEILSTNNGRAEVTEKEMVDAFFAETPFGFHGPTKSDMEVLGIDDTQYGHK